jgi:Hypervirulence associated proteins TUDOR domain
MPDKTFKAGDAVKWDHSQGTTQGKVVRKLTSPMSIKGHKVAASKDNPEYLVESDKTGARAAHKPDELRKA